MRKKAVSPAQRRAFAREVVGQPLCSQRQGCRFPKLARSTFNYRGRPATPAEEQLRKRQLELSAEHPRYGYRRIAALLRREGWRVGKRHIQRLRRDAGLRVPPTKRKIIRRGIATGLPTMATHRNHVWTWDFIADATWRGGALKMLTILDESRGSLNQIRAAVSQITESFVNSPPLNFLILSGILPNKPKKLTRPIVLEF